MTQVGERAAREVAEAARESEWRLPSFAKELFLGHFRLDLISPHPRPREDDRRRGEAFLAQLALFLQEAVDPLRIEREGRLPEQVIDGLRRIGALGMKIPEEYGGLGLTTVYYNRALELCGSWHSSIPTLLSAHQSIGVAEPVLRFGTEEQKRRYLPKVAGTEISAFLLTEPDVGSDPARMSSQAVPVDGGAAYELTGRKLWTTNGVIADRLVVMAVVPRSDGHRGGITCFIVDAHAPGVRVEHRNEFMGLRGIENGVTSLDRVRVPAADRLGREGEGLRIALTTLNTGRLALPALCAGHAKYALRIARQWSQERVQWGRPIGQHEAVAQKIAFLAATAFGLEAIVELSGLMADEGRGDIRIEAALAKLYASELAWQAADDLLQIRGGRGYETAQSLANRGERPVPVEQMLRDLRINRIFEGSSEIMRLLIAREAVDTHLTVAGDIISPDASLAAKARAGARAAAFYSRWLPSLAVGDGMSPGSFREFGRLGAHLRFVERSSRRLARSTFYGMARWQGGLEKRQAFLGRLVDIGAELFAMSAAVVRARMLAEEGETTATDLADLFCRQARRRVEDSFAALWRNDDAHNYALAQQVLADRFSWAESGVLDPSGDGPFLAAERGSENARRSAADLLAAS
ncbi:acyl-CoA dehydrogenase family protein [Frankia nepalensis]|uniref:Acyl-CoA dehydrogenase family protein n=1 Tax=Frankia nepalensis TaxID=1836974 RepID=A0A937RLE9_9ACTN|nr:acyl-CoA dehydrogenase family protein [Frankia nepalensis]MBL7628061.1 acyl-CoA dehydrogenase family protein [Frankia nepalensis]